MLVLGDLGGAGVSTGFVYGVLAYATARLAPFLDRLRQLLRAVRCYPPTRHLPARPPPAPAESR